ncbi:MAG TPA: Fe-S protein assembly co-chaperone HscB [Vicinamibacterales bacterium]|mgnify:CR=1 FL=1|nr:Fe-S protein assembly co-chaperone HscB [Vicinamibacterales bacterium]HPW19308.1 Fe-S protein assembly co-chaperone HscB [Vicinamibacterales bacterium]
MQPDTKAVPIDKCRHCGSEAPVDVHVCPRCDRLMTLGRLGDYFTFFGLRRRLVLDVQELDQRYRALSRLFHPDYFHNAPPAERLASLERASYLNDAHRTLRDPAARLEYLLKLEGFAPKQSREAASAVPQGLLEEVFALNEELEAVEELRESGVPAEAVAARLDEARRPVEATLEAHERRLLELAQAHDASLESGDAEGRRETLGLLETLLLERTYLTNLLAAVRRHEAGAGSART